MLGDLRSREAEIASRAEVHLCGGHLANIVIPRRSSGLIRDSSARYGTAGYSSVPSELAKIMESPSIGLRLNYTRRPRFVTLYVWHACVFARTRRVPGVYVHTINLRPITRTLSQLSERRRWRSHEQQSNDKSRQRTAYCMWRQCSGDSNFVGRQGGRTNERTRYAL